MEVNYQFSDTAVKHLSGEYTPLCFAKVFFASAKNGRLQMKEFRSTTIHYMYRCIHIVIYAYVSIYNYIDRVYSYIYMQTNIEICIITYVYIYVCVCTLMLPYTLVFPMSSPPGTCGLQDVLFDALNFDGDGFIKSHCLRPGADPVGGMA